LFRRVSINLSSLARNPFTDVSRAVSELYSLCFGDDKKLHAFTVDQKDVLEIDGDDATLIEHVPKELQVLWRNPTADAHDLPIVFNRQPVDPEAHWRFGSRFSLRRPLYCVKAAHGMSKANARQPSEKIEEI
jgi:hypothetical protein